MSRRQLRREELEQLLEDKLAQSALTMEHANALHFEPFDGATASTELDVPIALGGFRIPYFNFDGTESEFWRFRYLESTVNGFAKLVGHKELRYVQPKGSLNQIYLPPMIQWADVRDNPLQPIVITEGELKAASACAHDFPTIGLGGVWCFKSGASHMPILPQLAEINWDNRAVFICYDSDAATNSKVVMAENALAQALLTLGARVHIVRMPQLMPPNKTGLDDFLLYEGRQAFAELLGSADEWGPVRELSRLSEEVIYVRDPGVILKLDSMQRLSNRAFIDHAFATRKFFQEVQSGNRIRLVEKSAAAEWIKWNKRTEVERVTYKPGQERILGSGEFNTWRGWGCLPAEGDVTPWHELMDYIFMDQPDARKWFEQWLAYPLQNPGTKLFTAAVIWGTRHGTGKSLIGYTMFKIYGPNAVEITDKELGGSFNEWAQDRQFAMGDEIAGGDKRHSADRMKSMITQNELRVNQKYVPSYTIPDCINYYFTSNHPDAFFIEDTDRRFFVHECSRPPLVPEFYSKYAQWMKGPGPHSLFDYFLHLDMTGFQPQLPAPMTASKMDMIDNGRSDLGSWVAMLKIYPEAVVRIGDRPLGYKLVTAGELHSLYDVNRQGKTTTNGMARELARQGFFKVYKGMPVPTEQGPQKLWLVGKLSGVAEMSGPEIGEFYNNERGLKCKHTIKF